MKNFVLLLLVGLFCVNSYASNGPANPVQFNWQDAFMGECVGTVQTSYGEAIVINWWKVVGEDALGALGGGKIGFEVSLGNPYGAAAGAIIGGAIGSYCGAQSMVINPDVIGFPGGTTGPYNPFDDYGFLHNQIVNDFITNRVSSQNFDAMYSVASRVVSNFYSNSGYDFNNSTLKQGLRSFYTTTAANQTATIEQSLQRLNVSTPTKNSILSFLNSLSTIRNVGDFIQQAQSIETNILTSFSGTEIEKTNLQRALAVGRHSAEFWNPWNQK